MAMKHFTVLLTLATGLAACNGNNNSNTNVTPTQPAQPYVRWIPNWYSGDTLVATEVDAATGLPSGEFDTVYTRTVQDTSFVVYKGQRYYIFQYRAYPYDTTDKVSQVIPVCISTTRDTTGSVISLASITSAGPYRYRDAQTGQWIHQPQNLVMGDHVFFPLALGNVYASMRQY